MTHREQDKILLDQEQDRISTETSLLQDAQDALLEWDRYIHSLSAEEAQTALNGLREYAEAVYKELELEQGWIKDL